MCVCVCGWVCVCVCVCVCAREGALVIGVCPLAVSLPCCLYVSLSLYPPLYAPLSLCLSVSLVLCLAASLPRCLFGSLGLDSWPQTGGALQTWQKSQIMCLQGYLAHKKQPPLPKFATGPYMSEVPLQGTLSCMHVPLSSQEGTSDENQGPRPARQGLDCHICAEFARHGKSSELCTKKTVKNGC